jgi:hypothetical protein
MEQDDRREFQRLRLSKPILASMRSSNALLLDVGLGGAFVEHYDPVESGERFTLTFLWQGAEIQFLCEARRTTVVKKAAGGERAVSHTAVEFIEPVGDSTRLLRDMIGTLVGRLLVAQKANAAAEGRESSGATILAQLGDARRSRSRGYVVWRFNDGEWTNARTTSPKQPLDGFTVGAHEEDQEVQSLCATYETADEEGRKFIRLMAELSARKET